MPTDAVRRVRFPLSLKIVAWFFVNVAFLAVAAWLFVRAQLGPGYDALLAGPAGERLQTLAQLATDDLKDRPPSEWPAALTRLSAAYRLPMALHRHDGRRLAGETPPPPPEFLARLSEGQRPPGRRAAPVVVRRRTARRLATSLTATVCRATAFRAMGSLAMTARAMARRPRFRERFQNSSSTPASRAATGSRCACRSWTAPRAHRCRRPSSSPPTRCAAVDCSSTSSRGRSAAARCSPFPHCSGCRSSAASPARSAR